MSRKASQNTDFESLGGWDTIVEDHIGFHSCVYVLITLGLVVNNCKALTKKKKKNLLTAFKSFLSNDVKSKRYAFNPKVTPDDRYNMITVPWCTP